MIHPHIMPSRAIAFATLAFAGKAVCAPVDIGQFTPSPTIIGYSVYVTDTATLPSNSGLASGGKFGAGKAIFFGDGMKLPAPYITAGTNFTLGNNTATTVPTLNVGGNFTVGSATRIDSTVQVLGTMTANGNVTELRGNTYVKGAFSMIGNNDSVYKLLQLGGTYTANNPVFVAGSSVRMVSTLGGPAGATQAAFPATLPYGAPLVLPADTLPGFSVSGYSRPSTVKDVAVNTLGVGGATDTLMYRTGSAGTSYQSPQIWHCSQDTSASSTLKLGWGACHGDTLQPGYYGKLYVATGRVVILGEGFYSFDTITLSSQASIMAGQPTGGRTVLYSSGGIDASSGGNQFIGPTQARGANGLADFAGGTMMVVSASASGINIGSDQRIWATLSAPIGKLQFNSNLLLFGQAFGKTLGASNMLDFGAGAFIAFRGLVPTLNLSNFSVWEKTDPACTDAGGPCRDTVVTVSMPYTTAYPVRFRWRILPTSPASATAGVDFKVRSGWDTIPARSLTAAITVRIYDDSAYELPERFVVVLDSAYAAGFPGANGDLDTNLVSQTDTGTILNDDAPPRIRIARDSSRGILEGNSGTTQETFRVQLMNPTGTDTLSSQNAPQVAIPFWWSTKDGSATTADSDYVAVANRPDTIAAGTTRKRVSVLVKGDLRYENDETFLAALDSFKVATGGTPVLDTGWIRNDDAPPRISIGDASVTEPSTYGAVAYLDFPVTVSMPSGLPILFRWHTQDGTAQGTVDFSAVRGDFQKGAAYVLLPHDTVLYHIRIPVFGDTLHEGPETLSVVLDSLAGAALADSIGVGRITDADTMPPVFIDDASVQEPNSGSVPLSFHVHLARPSGLVSSFSWKTLAGSAKPGLDYTGVDSAFVSLRAGIVDTTVVVQILSDSVAGQGSHTFRLALWNLSGIVQGRDTATGTIGEAHPALRLRLDSVGTVVESETTVKFHLALDWYPADTVRVRFRTVSQGAHAPEQYEDTSGTLLFYPGKRLDSIPVRLHVDTVWEPALSFVLRLDSVVSRISLTTDSVGLATITDNGPVPSVEYLSQDTTVIEGTAGTVKVVARLSRPSGIALQALVPVRPSTTASSPKHYSFAGLSGDTLAFGSRNRTATFGIAVVNDHLDEPDRTVSLGIAGVSPLGTGADTVYTLKIRDDDHIPDVHITTPPADTTHTNQVNGTICWKVDGVAKPCSDTAWQQGWNVIRRCATSEFGLTGCDTHYVWLDNIAPNVQVFKIVGKNPHAPSQDTTWWGKKARTRFGVDTVWYWMRDSIENSDMKSWRVVVDTFRTVTNFNGDGLFAVPVEKCDSAGNCGRDTGWIDLKQSLPQVDILTPPEGAVVRIGRIGVTWKVTDNGKDYTFQDSHGLVWPGVDTVQRCYTDDVGNTGCDMHHILAQPIEALSGFYLDTDKDGRIDALVVNLGSPWVLPTLPTFDMKLDSAFRSGQKPDSLVKFYSGASRGRRMVVGTDTFWVAVGTYLYDSVGKIAHDLQGHPLTSILGDTIKGTDGKALRDSLDRMLYQVPGPGKVDSTRLVVRIKPPFAFGVTGFPPQVGHIQEKWTSNLGSITFLDTFPIADSVPPVILSAKVFRVENYRDPDTVILQPSEPIQTNGRAWLQVGTCSNDSLTCPDSLLSWHTVPADSVTKLPDGTWQLLVQPGRTGSVKPGYKVRFLSGVSDSLGNKTDTTKTRWSTEVTGTTRPPLVRVSQPGFVPYIPPSERDRNGPGDILLQATNGNSDSLQWWSPGRGYLNDNDPSVKSVCVERAYCNGPSVYINYPVRMILYIYDHAGVFVISRVVEITQADIDRMKGDKIDRVRVSMQWNHRTKDGQVVATGIYHWRVLSYVQLPDRPAPVIDNQLFRVGVKIKGEN